MAHTRAARGSVIYGRVRDVSTPYSEAFCLDIARWTMIQYAERFGINSGRFHCETPTGVYGRTCAWERLRVG